MMTVDACPNCEAALDPDLHHCDSPSCPWIRCNKCNKSVLPRGKL